MSNPNSGLGHGLTCNRANSAALGWGGTGAVRKRGRRRRGRKQQQWEWSGKHECSHWRREMCKVVKGVKALDKGRDTEISSKAGKSQKHKA